jgi:hypothetical protein
VAAPILWTVTSRVGHKTARKEFTPSPPRMSKVFKSPECKCPVPDGISKLL